ncbi:hypothetical protein PFISCL1PPCAC_9930, partial [Pristionchus fissidentatus]
LQAGLRHRPLYSREDMVLKKRGVIFCLASLVVLFGHAAALWYRHISRTPSIWMTLLAGTFMIILTLGVAGSCAKKKSLVLLAAFYLDFLSVVLFIFSFIFALFFMLTPFYLDSVASASHHGFHWLLPYLCPSYSSIGSALLVYADTFLGFVIAFIALYNASDDGWKLIEECELRLPCKISHTTNPRINIRPDVFEAYQRGLPTSHASPSEPPPPYRSCSRK